MKYVSDPEKFILTTDELLALVSAYFSFRSFLHQAIIQDEYGWLSPEYHLFFSNDDYVKCEQIVNFLKSLNDND